MAITTNDKALTNEQRDLVEQAMDIVYSISHSVTVTNSLKMKAKNISKDDLIQVGAMDLCKSVKRYKSNKGAKFSTYAYTSVEFAMMRHLDEYNLIKIPRRQYWELDTHIGNIDEIHSIGRSGLGSLNVEASNGDVATEIGDLIVDESNKYEDSDAVQSILALLDKTEIKILTLLNEGYSQTEMARITKIHQSTISRCIKGIRLKVGELYPQFL